ncbi:MAG: hypothetical protein OJF50_000910 [Nitrospira sp.]|nr:hypothetical protein [Nitrospira sp.]
MRFISYTLVRAVDGGASYRGQASPQVQTTRRFWASLILSSISA